MTGRGGSARTAGAALRTPGRPTVWGGALTLMVLPLLAVRDIGEFMSDPGDFMFLAILLAGVVAALEVAIRVPDRLAYRAGIGIALVAGLGGAWVNLAVGIIGSKNDPANLVFAAVFAIAALGAAVARFRPSGMARAMVAAAAAQAGAFVLALAAGLGFTGPITVFFVALWLIAAWLFQRAAPVPGEN